MMLCLALYLFETIILKLYLQIHINKCLDTISFFVTMTERSFRMRQWERSTSQDVAIIPSSTKSEASWLIQAMSLHISKR